VWKSWLFALTVAVSTLAPLVLTSSRPLMCLINAVTTGDDRVTSWKYAGRVR
ncbi:hypothetical protein AAVH_38435, partial [Aphelenchoides avenae]